MKALISVTFGILTAAVLAAGGYLVLESRKQHQGLLKQHRMLSERVSELEADLSRWGGRAGEMGRKKREIDSLVDTLSVLEPEVEEILTRKRGLDRTPELILGEPRERNGWHTYPFSLTLRGEFPALDSFMSSVQNQMPVMEIDRLQAKSSPANQLEMTVKGSLSFPITH